MISEPLRAPKRFNLVGLRWRGPGAPGIALRTRLDDGDWSRWTSVASQLEDAPDPHTGEPVAQRASDPVWVGEADWVQYRMTRRVRGVRLHFVNVQGTATAADRLRTALRGAVNAGVVTVAGVARADAAEPQPAIVPREDWGADDCRPRTAPDLGEVKAAFIHHTVTANDYTPEEAPQIVLGICRFHRNSNGWNDVGYNFLVDKYGTIYEGRAGGIDQPIIGAQAQGYNAQSTGIANLGTHSSVAPDAGGARRDGAPDPLEAAAPRHLDPGLGGADQHRRLEQQVPGRHPGAGAPGSPATATRARPPAPATRSTTSCRSCAGSWATCRPRSTAPPPRSGSRPREWTTAARRS